MSKHLDKQDGFIALISVIIISAILMLVATTLGFTSFFGRYNILDSELKEVGVGIAEACVDTALLKLSNNEGYSPSSEIINFGENACTIISVSPGYPKTIKVSSDYKNYITNLEVKLDSSDLSISGWEEVPSS